MIRLRRAAALLRSRAGLAGIVLMLAVASFLATTGNSGGHARAGAAFNADSTALRPSHTPLDTDITVLASPTVPVCEPGIAYCVYVVPRAETVREIATELDLEDGAVSAAQRVAYSNGPELTSEADLVPAWTKLRLPGYDGILHSVQKGETLSMIADMHEVEVADILGVPENSISDPDNLQVGREVLVPRPGSLDAHAEYLAGGRTLASDPNRGANSQFISPLPGRISSRFGKSHPLGIDIAGAQGAPIVAAAAGKVVFAGGDRCCSYGLYVVIDHGNGFTTVYGHFSRLGVTTGQEVRQGQLLGLAGSTGFATGPHLHFEVRYLGGPLDPLQYLPPSADRPVQSLDPNSSELDDCATTQVAPMASACAKIGGVGAGGTEVPSSSPTPMEPATSDQGHTPTATPTKAPSSTPTPSSTPPPTATSTATRTPTAFPTPLPTWTPSPPTATRTATSAPSRP